jgi:hypothetical protein
MDLPHFGVEDGQFAAVLLGTDLLARIDAMPMRRRERWEKNHGYRFSGLAVWKQIQAVGRGRRSHGSIDPKEVIVLASQD